MAKRMTDKDFQERNPDWGRTNSSPDSSGLAVKPPSVKVRTYHSVLWLTWLEGGRRLMESTRLPPTQREAAEALRVRKEAHLRAMQEGPGETP